MPHAQVSPLVTQPLVIEKHKDSVCGFYIDDVFSDKECEVCIFLLHIITAAIIKFLKENEKNLRGSRLWLSVRRILE